MKQSPLAFPFPLPLQLLALFPSVFASYILTTLRRTEIKIIFPGSSSRWLNFSSAQLPWLGSPAKLWPVALWSGYVIFWWARPESHVWGKESAPPEVKNHPAGLDNCSRKPKRMHSIPFFLHSTIYWMSSHVPSMDDMCKYKIYRAIWQYISGTLFQGWQVLFKPKPEG